LIGPKILDACAIDFLNVPIVIRRLFSAYTDMRFSSMGSRNISLSEIDASHIKEFITQPMLSSYIHGDICANADFSEYLANCLLPQSDQILMGYGIEGRVPLIAPSLVRRYRNYSSNDNLKTPLRTIINNSRFSNLDFSVKDGFGAIPEIFTANYQQFMIEDIKKYMNLYYSAEWIENYLQTASISDVYTLYSIYYWIDSVSEIL
jgi:hypothetical protein